MADPPEGTRLGIAFSGGGIRAATFALGVYQRLAEAGIFQRARYLSGVSGGSYLASGMAISHAKCPDELCDVDPPQWGRGSPEEARLRENLSYLAPGGNGRLWLFANVLYGLLMNLIPLVVGALVAGRLMGIALAHLYPGLGGDDVDRSMMVWFVAAGGLFLFLALVAVGMRRFSDRDEPRLRVGREKAEPVVSLLLFALVGVVVLLLGLPELIQVLARQTSSSPVTAGAFDGQSWHYRQFAVAGIGVLAAVVCGGVALWLLSRRRLKTVRGILGGLAGASVVSLPFVISAEMTAVQSGDPGSGRFWVVSGAILVIFAVCVHNRRYSMHLFYRERIQEAFTSRRASHDGMLTADPIKYSEAIRLSEVAKTNLERGGFPELVVCAAVAARGSEVPSKTRAASFTFEGEKSRNTRLGLDLNTTDIEQGDWIGGGGITLPSMMAISGAAVSPLMGRFTLPAFRFMMAMLNVRLGVWVRNGRPAANRSGRNPIVRLMRWVSRGWREPGSLYVLREGLGRARAHGRFIYISDGGHWENLGLVELLRRRCDAVVVVDASGNPSLGDIGRGMAIARAELGVEFDMDPRTAAPDGEGGPNAPVSVGNFAYPDGITGTIYYARSVLWDSAPSDLHLFASRDRLFPHHPTFNQFLSGEVFDAYRALGRAVGGELVGALRLPDPEMDEPPPGTPPPPPTAGATAAVTA